MVNYDKKKRNFFISYSNNPTVLKNFLPKNKECRKIGSIYEIPFNMISYLENLFKKIKKTKNNKPFKRNWKLRYKHSCKF